MSSVVSAERSQSLADLLVCIAQGDRTALATLYQRTSAHLYGVVLLMHDANAALAGETLQEVFVQVWHTASQFDARLDQPLTWLVGIARQRAIELRRLRNPPAWVTPGDEDTVPLTDAPPPEIVCMAMLARANHRSINALGPLEQQGLGLAFYLGLSVHEIGIRLREPISAIKASLRQALPTLRRHQHPIAERT